MSMNVFAQLIWLNSLIYSISASQCERFRSCSQKCELVGAQTRCSCVDGFKLTGNKSCSPNDPKWKLIYSSENGIHSISNPGSVQQTLFKRNEYSDFVGVTGDVRNNVVYWTNNEADTPAVYMTTLLSSTNNNNASQAVVDVGTSNPAGIAFDWITGNFYFVDSHFMFIAVCAVNPTRCSVVVQKNHDNYLRTIALHPNQGIMFWTDRCNDTKSCIMRANMDGSFATAIASTNGGWPNGITVDEANSRVYWVQPTFDRIESSRFDGSYWVVVRAGIRSSGIDIFGDFIFWSLWWNTQIMKADKFIGQNKPTVLTKSGIERITGLFVMHIGKQPKLRSNLCENLTCSHVCALSGESQAQCLCPAGMLNNGSICIDDEKQPRLLVAKENTLFSMPINAVGKDMFKRISLPSEIKIIGALVYNPINKSLIIYERSSNKIVEFNTKRNELRILVENDMINVTSIDIDVISENLIWADAGKQTIEVLFLRTMSRIVTRENVADPRKIIYSPDLGLLYLLTGNLGNGGICKIFLGKQSEDTHVTGDTTIPKPTQMTYNQETGRAIFIYCKEGYIFSREETNLSTLKPFWVAFSLLAKNSIREVVKIKDKVFLMDMDNSNEIKVVTAMTINKVKNNNFGSTDSKRVMTSMNNDIEHLHQRRNAHACSPMNTHSRKLCSQVCLPVGLSNEGTCWCSDGFHLSADGLSCDAATVEITTEKGSAMVTTSDHRLEESTAMSNEAIYTTTLTPAVTVKDEVVKLTTERSSSPTKNISAGTESTGNKLLLSTSLPKADQSGASGGGGGGGSSVGAIIGYVVLAICTMIVVGMAVFLIVYRMKFRDPPLISSASYSNIG